MIQDEKPRVSVVITVRNAEDFISATLASILQERNISLEVVLIDNGCTDATIDRAREVNDDRLRILQGPCTTISAALNVAYVAIRGEIVMRCDGDDLYPAQRIAQQVEWLEKHPEFGAVCGDYSMIDAKGRLIFDQFCQDDVAKEINEELCSRFIRSHICAYAVRAEVLRAMGGSREYFKNYEDHDFLLRLGETCRVWYLPNPHYYYRVHSSSVTYTKKVAEQDFLRDMTFKFQRQRLTQGSDDLQRGCPPEVPKFEDKLLRNTTSHLQSILLGYAWSLHQSGHKRQALSFGARSVMAQPSNFPAWRSLIALAVKKPAGKEAFAANYRRNHVDPKYFAHTLSETQQR